MRGDKQSLLKGASIVDLEGNEKFQIIPNVWVKVMVVSFILIMGLAFLLALMAVSNRQAIDNLKKQVEQPNANSPDTNR